MERPILIEPASPSDAAALAALSIEVWIGTYLKQGISRFFAEYVLSEFTTSRMEDMLTDTSQHVLVSRNADGIDGFIRLSFGAVAPVEGDFDTEIATFYVQPRHHGSGVGTALLNAALAACRARGVTRVWLATNAQNTPAIDYYLRQGFTQVGETHFRVQDQAYLNNVYGLEIPERRA